MLRLLTRSVARYLLHDDMQRVGTGRVMRLSKRYNRLRFGRQERFRRTQFRTRFAELIHENGAPEGPVSRFSDGYAIDTSGKLPHLDALLSGADEIIAERGLTGFKSGSRKPFLMDILKREDLARFPAFLNFILSSEVLTTAAEYLQSIPVLSTTIPPGVRLTESTTKFDPLWDGPLRESQLYHLDHHDSPLIYVIVLLKDVTPECGPFTFLPASASATAAKALRYRDRGVPYRIPDETMYSLVPESAAITYAYPRGTVLFLDSSRCFHYGSRQSVQPRYQMMFALTSACRTDLTETLRGPWKYPTRGTGSELRRMVLNRDYPRED